MLFNPDHSTPAEYVLFSGKNLAPNNPTISLNRVQLEIVSYQKYHYVILDEKSNFEQHFNSAILKVNKGIKS